MEILAATIFMGTLATGTPGLPSRDEREFVDATKRYCAVARDTNPDHDMRQCILGEMERRKAELLADIKRGEWRR